jgi:hypothetical protein
MPTFLNNKLNRYILMFQHSLVIYLRSWFNHMKGNSTPLVVSLAMTPIRVINSFSNLLGNLIYQYLTAILSGAAVLFSSIIAYHYMPRFVVIIARVCGSFTLAIINWSVSHLSFWLVSAHL